MSKILNFIAIMLAVSLVAVSLNNVHAEDTTIQLVPQASTVEAGTTFTLNLTVTDVIDLAVWQFRIFYFNTILNCTSAAKGPFLEKNGNSQFFSFKTYNSYNATHGCVLLGSSLLGAVPGVNGSGLLAAITFKALRGGDTQLKFDNNPEWNFLKDSTFPTRNPIPYTASDGSVHVTGAGPDIAITGISLSKTIVCQGYSLNINVTSTNEGESAETFNITVYADATVIAEQAVTLNIGSTETTTILCTTASSPIGLHVIWAYAQPVLGETDVADNNFTDGNVQITRKGDINPEFGTVDIFDIVVVASAFGSIPGSYNWNPIADINNDMIVDIFDIVVVATSFG